MRALVPEAVHEYYSRSAFPSGCKNVRFASKYRFGYHGLNQRLWRHDLRRGRWHQTIPEYSKPICSNLANSMESIHCAPSLWCFPGITNSP